MLKFSAWLACLTGGLVAAITVLIKFSSIETNFYISPHLFWASVSVGLFLLGSGLISLCNLHQGRTFLRVTWIAALAVSFIWISQYIIHALMITPAKAPVDHAIPTISEIVGLAILIGVELLGWILATIGNEPQ